MSDVFWAPSTFYIFTRMICLDENMILSSCFFKISTIKYTYCKMVDKKWNGSVFESWIWPYRTIQVIGELLLAFVLSRWNRKWISVCCCWSNYVFFNWFVTQGSEWKQFFSLLFKLWSTILMTLYQSVLLTSSLT